LYISQRHLAELAEVAVHTLSNLESGKGNPSLDVLERLLNCLGLQMSVGPRPPLTEPSVTDFTANKSL